MKSALKFVVIVLIFSLCFGMLSGCSPSKPADVLARFEKANNDRDMKALLDCYDPDAAEFFKALGEGVAGMFGFSVDTDAMLPFLSKALQSYAEKNDVAPKVKLTETSTEMVNDKKATINYTETLIFVDGTTKDYARTMTVIKNSGKWYIAMF